MTEQRRSRRDPFSGDVTYSECDTCDRPLRSKPEQLAGRCPDCTEGLAAGDNVDHLRQLAALDEAEYHSARIDGRPWWEAQRPAFVAGYNDIDAINVELPIAREYGYEITSVTALAGQHNLGAIAFGYWVLGALGAALAARRPQATVIVIWSRTHDGASEPATPPPAA